MLSHFNKNWYFSILCDPVGLTQTGNLSSRPRICLLSRQPNAALRQLEEHSSSFHNNETARTLWHFSPMRKEFHQTEICHSVNQVIWLIFWRCGKTSNYMGKNKQINDPLKKQSQSCFPLFPCDNHHWPEASGAKPNNIMLGSESACSSNKDTETVSS